MRMVRRLIRLVIWGSIIFAVYYFFFADIKKKEQVLYEINKFVDETQVTIDKAAVDLEKELENYNEEKTIDSVTPKVEEQIIPDDVTPEPPVKKKRGFKNPQ